MNRMDGKGEGWLSASGKIFDFIAKWHALTIRTEGKPASLLFEGPGSGVSKGVTRVDER